MSLTIQEVEHIANLARLHLTGEEKQKFSQQLSQILDYIARLQELDTSQIPPTFSLIPDQSPLREDEVQPGLLIDQLLSNAPQVEANQFRVPPVLE
jgi:aspartyl-tRNA(Asn)/glutamyl-tRNA(Gln) amidotransferase subunit C